MKSTGQLFCRMSLKICLIYSHDSLRLYIFGKNTTEVNHLSALPGLHDIYMSYADVNLDHLARGTFARLLLNKVTIFPL